PSTVAPLAWSPDGSLLAHMAPDGRVGLTLASTAEAVMVLDNPAITSVGAHPGSVNPPAGLTFTPDGEGLVVVHESGAVQWRCDGPGEVPAEDLPVELAGPATVVENETATWAFEHEPLELPAVHGLRDTADGTLFAASLSAALPAALWGPGEHSVVGVVDTGLRRGTTLPLTVQVLNGSW
ncbi:MAG: hypothetical protein FJ098_07700, partial [Deltaproteobacteria bacterium]|nr:hypothetical protein [Deltaproteobacteria bacterium]